MIMIEAVVNMKDGTQATIYVRDYVELFAEINKPNVENLESAVFCNIDPSDMRQGRDGRRSP